MLLDAEFWAVQVLIHVGGITILLLVRHDARPAGSRSGTVAVIKCDAGGS